MFRTHEPTSCIENDRRWIPLRQTSQEGSVGLADPHNARSRCRHGGCTNLATTVATVAPCRVPGQPPKPRCHFEHEHHTSHSPGNSRQLDASSLSPPEAPHLCALALTRYSRAALGNVACGLRNRRLPCSSWENDVSAYRDCYRMGAVFEELGIRNCRPRVGPVSADVDHPLAILI